MVQIALRISHRRAIFWANSADFTQTTARYSGKCGQTIAQDGPFIVYQKQTPRLQVDVVAIYRVSYDKRTETGEVRTGVIIGFGFGSPLVSLLMLLVTASLSYLVYRLTTRRRGSTRVRPTRAQLRQYYYEQRRRAQELSEEFNLTDEEIEQRIDEELGHPPHHKP